MGTKGRRNIKKPKKISWLAKGVKPRLGFLEKSKPVKIAFMARGKAAEVEEGN